MAGCIIKQIIEWSLPEVYRTLYEEVIFKVCDSKFVLVLCDRLCFGNRLSPKGKTLDTGFFLIT